MGPSSRGRLKGAVTDEPVPELGYGTFVHQCGVPYRVFTLEGMRIGSVAVGNGFTVAVTEAGAVYSFGMADGRLSHGDGDEDEGVFLPKRIEALDGIHVVSVAAEDFHALALTRCGRVYSSGGHGRDSPVHGLGSESDDDGSSDIRDDAEYYVPQLIEALLGERVRAIAAGQNTSCAVTDAGALYTWGRNDSGNLGHGDVLDRDRPTLVQWLLGIRVVGVSMHNGHTLALAADGSVYAFGEGPGLGISQGGEAGVTVSMRTPQRIPISIVWCRDKGTNTVAMPKLTNTVYSMQHADMRCALFMRTDSIVDRVRRPSVRRSGSRESELVQR
jgi:alpha-tubulin suppressor-like RCC1 family protein